jgi:hypothetical protein
LNAHDFAPGSRPVGMWTGSNAACPCPPGSTTTSDSECWVPHEMTRGPFCSAFPYHRRSTPPGSSFCQSGARIPLQLLQLL